MSEQSQWGLQVPTVALASCDQRAREQASHSSPASEPPVPQGSQSREMAAKASRGQRVPRAALARHGRRAPEQASH